MARSSTPKPPAGAPPRWRRASLWGVATIATAVIGLVVSGVGQSATTWFAAATTTGPPVTVRVDVQPSIDDVSIPSDQTVSPSDLARLSTMTARDADTWLVKHKNGVPTYGRSMAVTFTGNRQDTVRIMGMTVHSTCKKPDRGTLIRQADGRGDGADSEHMVIYPQEDDPGPFKEGTQSDYFPARTITLKPHEQVVTVVDVEPGAAGMDDEDPASTRECDITLSVKVLQGNTETAETIPGSLTVMDVEPTAAEPAYAHVYLGTGLCDGFYAAPVNWAENLVDACGVGGVDSGG